MTEAEALRGRIRAHCDAVVATDPAATGGRNSGLTYMAVQRGSRRFGVRSIATPLDGAPGAHSGWRTRYNATAEAIAALALEAHLAGDRTSITAGHWSRPKSATERAGRGTTARAALREAVRYLEERGHAALCVRLRRRLNAKAEG